MLTQTERTLLKHVDRERLVESCAELVRTPTVNLYSGDRNPPGELAGQLIVERTLQQLGARTERVECPEDILGQNGVLGPSGRIRAGRPNIIGTLPFGSGGGPTLLIDAHMDTVAVDHYDGDPFAGDVRDGCLWGRGTTDDKGGVAVMLEAVTALQNAQLDLNGNIVCCSVVEEECDGGGRGSMTCIDHLAKPDAAVVIDGSFGSLWNGCTGVVTAHVKVSGRAGHAAYGNSVNAIEKAVSLLNALRRFRELRGDRPGDFNLGTFHAGDHPANVPDEATFGMNIKTDIEDMQRGERECGLWSGKTVRNLFDQCIAEAVSGDEFFQESPPETSWVKDLPASLCRPEHRWVIDSMEAAFEDVCSAKPSVTLLGGWGDIAHFLNSGIPSVGIGPGSPGVAHSASESVNIEHLHKTAEMLTLFIHRFFADNERH
ncbi:MAG: M20/M25/M40 family metallo-hydrolase [Lentisphaerae bacterium]|jgi:acetylornithine deacetylase|nr:M20/M25/M40 family metallo-hydrolase [Lentisphaerota bacterium]MBT4820072.1 M20/M25/M40 family metallo-hydrolase [Lentisphaerota bacterium]MBT5604762.1 M20/M25/M40 family metallo-hydrolase [Lentisphaerota bacterium]MBT7053894.1 M20/M25/M40 family metallo-hydrolase [Lentisphaerota bacterium]MBT7842816.1 M20/M25/M40 family metallo-hydrolase [Lentisphaerota bacterium]